MNTPQPREIFDASVRQVKRPPRRFSAASPPPATATPSADNRAKHHGSEHRQTVSMGGRVRPHIKAAYAAMIKARGAGWTESRMVATVLEEWLEHDLGEKFGVRLAATVTTAIHENFRSYDKHLAFLSVEAYVKSATALNVLLDFLRRYVVKDPQELHAMQNNADHLARTSLGEWSKEKG